MGRWQAEFHQKRHILGATTSASDLKSDDFIGEIIRLGPAAHFSTVTLLPVSLKI